MLHSVFLLIVLVVQLCNLWFSLIALLVSMGFNLKK